jgi:hypothetical protein
MLKKITVTSKILTLNTSCLISMGLNEISKDDIYRHLTKVTWVAPPTGLKFKMAIYVEHFMELRDDLIVKPPYTLWHWIYSLRLWMYVFKIPLGQFCMGFH